MSNLVGYHRVSSAAQDLELGRAALVKAGVPENRIYAEKVSGKSKDNRGTPFAKKDRWQSSGWEDNRWQAWR